MPVDDLIPIVIFSLVIVWFVVCGLKELKRSRELPKVAARLNMEYTKKLGPFADAGFMGFKLFGKGRGKKVTHMMRRSDGGVETICFEYQYTTGHGKSSKTHRQTVVAITSSDIRLPAFVAEPENVFMRVAQKITEEDIDFYEYPKFSKMFQLKGPDEDAVRSIFSGKIIRFFEKNKGLSVEAKSDQVLLYRKDRRPSPKQIEGAIKEGLEFFGLLKQVAG